MGALPDKKTLFWMLVVTLTVYIFTFVTFVDPNAQCSSSVDGEAVASRYGHDASGGGTTLHSQEALRVGITVEDVELTDADGIKSSVDGVSAPAQAAIDAQAAVAADTGDKVRRGRRWLSFDFMSRPHGEHCFNIVNDDTYVCESDFINGLNSKCFFVGDLKNSKKGSPVNALMMGMQRGASKEAPLYIAETHVRDGKRFEAPVMCLPEYMLIGVAKTGSTSFYSYATQHPNLEQTSRKEMPRWAAMYKKGGYGKMHSQMVSCFNSNAAVLDPRTVFGDHSILNWSSDITMPRKLATINHQMKLVALLREPVQRVVSAYWYFCRKKNRKKFATMCTPEILRKTVEKDIASYHTRFLDDTKPYDADGGPPPTRINDVAVADGDWTAGVAEACARGIPNPANDMYKDPTLKSTYVCYLKWWMHYYPKRQLLLIDTEHLESNTQDVMNDVYEFIGIGAHKLKSTAEANVFKEKEHKHVYLSTLVRLYRYFKSFNEQLTTEYGFDHATKVVGGTPAWNFDVDYHDDAALEAAVLARWEGIGSTDVLVDSEVGPEGYKEQAAEVDARAPERTPAGRPARGGLLQGA